MNKLKQWFTEKKQDIISWLKRNVLLIIAAFLAANYLGFEQGILNIMAMTILFTCLGILISGAAVWSFTRLEFIKEKDTTALVGIFRSIMVVIAAIVISYYFGK